MVSEELVVVTLSAFSTCWRVSGVSVWAASMHKRKRNCRLTVRIPLLYKYQRDLRTLSVCLYTIHRTTVPKSRLHLFFSFLLVQFSRHPGVDHTTYCRYHQIVCYLPANCTTGTDILQQAVSMTTTTNTSTRQSQAVTVSWQSRCCCSSFITSSITSITTSTAASIAHCFMPKLKPKEKEKWERG